MTLTIPRSLSPSRITNFKDCPLAFKFSVIDGLPEPPSIHAVRGTLMHRALERLFWEMSPGRRTRDRASELLAFELKAMAYDDPDLVDLALSQEESAKLRKEGEALLDGYFSLEDPDGVDAVGLELALEAEVAGVKMRGIIDRLDRTASGDLVITDYKTGRAPGDGYERSRLTGVNIYALLCEEVLGVRPAAVRLVYLKAPCTITSVPSAQMIESVRRNVHALWQAILRACELDDFRPRPSGLCNWCGFRQFCPAFAATNVAGGGGGGTSESRGRDASGGSKCQGGNGRRDGGKGSAASGGSGGTGN